jgi:WD40 repeat protein
MTINMERPGDEVDYSYLVLPFHARAINGMDVCIKKPYIATSSGDRTVKIWSYTA